MADTAFQTQYRQELISAYEVGECLLGQSVTDEAVIKGNTATFLIAGSGDATAVTRGVNGRIPGRPNDLTQTSCTLEEWHDKPEISGFNMFASQGNISGLMQKTTKDVINRKKDELILAQLATASNTTGTAQQGSHDLVVYAKTILGNNKVAFDGQITAVISPAMNGYLEQVPEYASADFREIKPLEGGNGNSYAGRPKARFWSEVHWIVHPSLTGAGTAAEKCFMFHRDAIGCAMDVSGMSTYAGYNEEEDYSFARCSGYMGSKLLQNSGVVVINHDGSEYAAQ